jgi:hypothetical protein
MACGRGAFCETCLRRQLTAFAAPQERDEVAKIRDAEREQPA